MIRLERKRSSSEESDKLGFARSLIIDGPISLGHLRGESRHFQTELDRQRGQY